MQIKDLQAMPVQVGNETIVAGLSTISNNCNNTNVTCVN